VGHGEFARLDRLHAACRIRTPPAAVIAGGTEINSHFGNPPFQDQELAGNPKAHIVLNSYDVLGGPSSATVLYATEKFRNENPKTYRAFIDALNEAAQLISANPELAADIYLRVTKSKLDRALPAEDHQEPAGAVQGGAAEHLGLAQFLHQVGAIKKQPASWRDYFFDTRRWRRAAAESRMNVLPRQVVRLPARRKLPAPLLRRRA
jgi:NitT/TauT family transport system substrate-binding protein